jgi:hypothetical protein
MADLMTRNPKKLRKLLRQGRISPNEVPAELQGRMEKAFNPCCGYLVDAAAKIPEFEPKLPQAGDIAVCFNCGQLLVYLEDSKNLTQIAHLADLGRLRNDDAQMIYKAQCFIRKRGPFKSLS